METSPQFVPLNEALKCCICGGPPDFCGARTRVYPRMIIPTPQANGATNRVADEHFSTPSEVHRKLWPAGTLVFDEPKGDTGKLGWRSDIEERMARKIYEAKISGAVRGGATPKFIYLGREEWDEFEREMHRTAWHNQTAGGSGEVHPEGKTIFMGVEVITVDKPSHLAVGE